MAEKLLRGKAPLTVWRGIAGAAGGHLYRGGLIDANAIDPTDRDRLVAEGFLEPVVRDGESFVLAEDTATGDKGDAVTVGDNGIVPADEVDPGTTNTVGDTTGADPEVGQRQAAARAKLAETGGTPDGRASNDVLVEYLVGKGYARAEVEKADRNELRKLVADVQK